MKMTALIINKPSWLTRGAQPNEIISMHNNATRVVSQDEESVSSFPILVSVTTSDEKWRNDLFIVTAQLMRDHHDTWSICMNNRFPLKIKSYYLISSFSTSSFISPSSGNGASPSPPRRSSCGTRPVRGQAGHPHQGTRHDGQPEGTRWERYGRMVEGVCRQGYCAVNTVNGRGQYCKWGDLTVEWISIITL